MKIIEHTLFSKIFTLKKTFSYVIIVLYKEKTTRNDADENKINSS